MSTVNERFTAAVNVIKSLPKNGSYQPSNDMMLKFYSYFKQATLGPNTHRKPAFWDVVNKAKWDAWKRLGNMPKEQAMENYVNELKKIIETMSYTDNVANFMGSISELDGISVTDLETVAPEAIKKVKSQPNSPFASRESSPIRAPMLLNGNSNMVNGNGNITIPTYENGNGISYINGTHESDYSSQNGYTSPTDHSDDEYIDTVEDESEIMSVRSRISNLSALHNSRPKNRISGDFSSTQTLMSVNSDAPNIFNDNSTVIDILTQLSKTVDKMNKDLQHMTNRMDVVEKTFHETIKSNKQNNYIIQRQYPEWWPFKEISPNWFVFMIVWPFLAQKIVHIMQKKK